MAQDSVKVIPLGLYRALVGDAWVKHQYDTLIVEMKDHIMFLQADKALMHQDYSKLIGNFTIEREVFLSKEQTYIQINRNLNSYIDDIIKENVKLKKGMKLVKIMVPIQIGFFGALLLMN